MAFGERSKCKWSTRLPVYFRMPCLKQVYNITQSSAIFSKSILHLNADYLNPVPKDQIVRECGLRSGRGHEIGSDYYVTEIDPIALGVNMNANGEEEVLFGDDFNLNYFGIVSGNNIMA